MKKLASLLTINGLVLTYANQYIKFGFPMTFGLGVK